MILRDLIEKLIYSTKFDVFYMLHKQTVYRGDKFDMPDDILKHFGNKLVKNIACRQDGVMIIWID